MGVAVQRLSRDCENMSIFVPSFLSGLKMMKEAPARIKFWRFNPEPYQTSPIVDVQVYKYI